MIPLPSVRAYVCVEPVDMRKQIDGLAQMVAAVFAADALSGQVFVFLGKRRNKVKLLWWDRSGFFLLYKRLERGRFPRPDTSGSRWTTRWRSRSKLRCRRKPPDRGRQFRRSWSGQEPSFAGMPVC